MQIYRFTCLAIALAIAEVGCGGRGNAPIPSPTAGTVLSGITNVPSLTIPAGQTLNVTSSPFVNSSGPVEIDGSVTVASGASVVFVAPSVTITNAVMAPGGAFDVVSKSITIAA